MRHILIVLLLVQAVLTHAQNNISPTKNDLLQKSKHQKKMAVILLAAGAALVTTSFIIPEGDADGGIDIYLNKTHENDGIKAALGLTGLLGMLGSIPLFIASSKNHKKAMSISFKNENLIQPQKFNIADKKIPSLAVKISL